MSRRLRLGFIALNDAASVIVAHQKGFFARQGLAVELSREVSWATVRDKMRVGALDGAHMLAPMALAMTLGEAGAPPTPLSAPMALNLNGPAVTVSTRLAAAIQGRSDAAGLARLIARRREEGASPLTFAVVFPFSVHNYLLRDWLARSGIDPDRDIQLMIAPPARMTELLVEGVVEGFCVTEPWDTAAVAAGAGAIAIRGSQLWPRMPDKVFAVTETWAEENPEVLQALLRAMLEAAAWADEPGNRLELAAILSQPQNLAAPAPVIESSLGDIVFQRDGASIPAPVHAAWLLTQMKRWGHIAPGTDIAALVRQVYRPDLHAAAARAVGQGSSPAIEVLDGFDPAGPYRMPEP